MKANHKQWAVMTALWVVAGFLFDYGLYQRNAPAGVSYSPTWRFIVAWPYYLIVVAANLAPTGLTKGMAVLDAVGSADYNRRNSLGAETRAAILTGAKQP